MDYTIDQSSDDQRRSQQLSLGRAGPPVEAEGYESIRFLGAGAFGEVWVALEKNTGRQVAVKYYTAQGGLDWTFLHREVEKLLFLTADRYVVQLIGVGWKSTPPYYVMEYVETGSLDDQLRRQGRLSLAQAEFCFREIAIGLSHAHGKGVLHCDLKPANILMDQDGRPRLADFGQSRLSSDQTPSLGTLFYMAPEQADLSAAPDARWDVYGLGALLYSMLVGHPPRRDSAAVDNIEKETDLAKRLLAYQKALREAPPVKLAARVKGCDKALAQIVERCLAIDPAARYPNVQAVLDALAERARQRAWRPLWLLGAILPAAMLLLGSLFVWSGIEAAVRQTDSALTDRALRSSQFAAEYVAQAAAESLQKRYRDLQVVASNDQFLTALREYLEDADVSKLRVSLREDNSNETVAAPLRDELRATSVNQKLQKTFELLTRYDVTTVNTQPLTTAKPPLTVQSNVRSDVQGQAVASASPAARAAKKITGVRSWFVTDARGLQIARNPPNENIGRYYARRTYFHGGPEDLPDGQEPAPGQHVREPSISAVYQSENTKRWTVALSTPLINDEGEFLGVLGLSLEFGKIIAFKSESTEFPVLVDMRPGKHQGLILQHPHFLDMQKLGTIDLSQLIIPQSMFPDAAHPNSQRNYIDPLDLVTGDRKQAKRYLAASQPVVISESDTDNDPKPCGLWVAVQTPYQESVGATLSALRVKLLYMSGLATLLLSFVIVGLWWLATRMGRFVPDLATEFAGSNSESGNELGARGGRAP